ncbi:hypothetical protein LZ30DRAFT_749502 [Colletotrichum cereale]|nr:hypothetical protein LZ30DRAFT_749502 [Colletotrichum cereale]
MGTDKRAHGDLTCDAYTVGWICALPDEHAAAVDMLDIEHECHSIHNDDTNTYALGSIGRHNVVIACMSEYGLVSAAVVASHMKRSFPSIRTRLMVGIGGGAPSRVDVRLGDVVVSHPTATSTGVEQYDSGKTETGGLFNRKGKLNKPPQELLTAVAVLRAHHASRPSQIPGILARLKEKNPRMTYQGVEKDRLFEAGYEHQGHSCTGCDPSRLVKREARLDNNPRIHYGVIASANRVMKHGITRDRITEELNVLCFEMEAAGLMDNFPCLVIRGICDYADSHKTKEWQPYAAAVAAAYAKELLLITHTHEVQKAVSLGFKSIDNRRTNIKREHAKTCQWLMQHPAYTDWQDVHKFSEHHGLLWISGKPGAGKSTIMKVTSSQESRREQGTVISFFFNARGGDLEKTVIGLYRSLLYQLLTKLPGLQKVLDGLSASFLGKDMTHSWSLDRLKSLFLKVIEGLGTRRVTCFIDALDECAEDEVREMLTFFEELGECAASNKTLLYACFSSRHYPHIHIDHGLKLIMEAQAGHAKDLEDYVHTKLKNEDGESPQTIEIVEEILRKASGVFMWVVLVIEILNREFEDGRMFAVRKRLDTIPEKLSDLFRDMLTRDNENMDDLHLCIQWILYSRIPLKRQEYYFAMVSGLSPESLGERGSAQISEDAMDRFVVNSSKGLAETTATSQTTETEPTVQFIHESVRDFLLKDNGIQAIWPEAAPDFEAASHEELKSCCAAYIKFADLKFLPPLNRAPKKLPKARGPEAIALQRKLLGKYPFAEYANSQLFFHADSAAASASQYRFMEEFMSTGRFKWVVVYNLFEIKGRTALLIATERRQTRIVEELLRLGADMTRKDKNGRTTLDVAIEKGHTSTVMLFFTSDSFRGKPDIQVLERGVSWAMSFKRYAMVEALLEHNLQVDADFGRKYPSYLETAVEKNLVSVARLLLRTGAQDDGSLLRFAIQMGSEEMVQTLLDGDTDPNSSDERGYTALHLAAEFDLEDMARLLLGKSADFQKQDVAGRTPLCVASAKGHFKTAKVLLAEGADVSHTDAEGRNALWSAVSAGHQRVVKLLLDNYADVQCAYTYGYTPLHLAAQSGDHHAARTLLANGARVNQTDHEGKTPLHYASHSNVGGCTLIIRELVESGADVDSRDNRGKTPIFSACRYGNQRCMRLLLENGANVNCTANNGETALLTAVAAQQIHLLQELIDFGADVKISNINGINALSKWIETFRDSCRPEDLIPHAMKMLHRGTSATGAYTRGLTILHLICKSDSQDRRSIDFARQVLSYGADVNARDNEGRTPILLAAEQGNSFLVDTLLKDGAHPNLEDKHGSTPLFEAMLLADKRYPFHDIRTISVLIRGGATPKTRNPGGDCIIRRWVFELKKENSHEITNF